MNKGVDKCYGEYVLFLNSGDYLHNKNVIETVYDKLDTDIVYGGLVVHNKNKSTFIINDDYKLNNGLPHPSCFTRVELLEKYKFNENYKIINSVLSCLSISERLYSSATFPQTLV